ncbi:DEAD/DEAH box helicase [Geosporobacter ferrireducens]|uniref:Helicase n=1 Tax=Geosporobacter ferrireducens TaxID=1424294 RepID=A0A1D8GNV4_9FIRM|nr:DEAD/DEAH box helicase [Geosporobacter ferrireducens]AOT72621.1 helicase [Geosporobacter ferrireducens]
MPLSINDAMIRNAASNSSTLIRGIGYYLDGRVQKFSFDEDTLTAHAIVVGEKPYKVEAAFQKNGNMGHWECSCPAYMNYDGACKHIIALLKLVQKEFQSQRISIEKQKNSAHEIFAYFEEFHEESGKAEVELGITFELEHIYKGVISSIELKIGESRLYVVRNMADFLENIERGEKIQFGKSFTYDPKRHRFSSVDKEIIELLLEIYENEKVVGNLSYNNYRQDSLLKGKKVYLSSPLVKRVLDILQFKSFSARILGREYTNIRIAHQDIPFHFDLKSKEDDLLLQLNWNDNLIPLNKKGDYFFYKGVLYSPSEKQKKYFLPFYHILIKQKRKDITFTQGEKERFVSEILPQIQAIGKVTISSEVAENIYEEKLMTKMFLDKIDGGIASRIEFHYGEEMINPFSSKDLSARTKKIIVRNVEEERSVLNILEKSEFIVSVDKVILKDEERIFRFLQDNLKKLQELAEIYYSDDFKSMVIKETVQFSVSVRMNDKSSMFEFSFEHEDIPPEELTCLLEAFKERKKYYRLKNGAFLPLENTDIKYLNNLIEYLDLTQKDLNKKSIEIPKYRALYLDEILRETPLFNVERNQAFKQLVQNIKEPKDMDYAVPSHLKTVLRDYQKTGFKWLKTLAAYEMGGILADDMGLGKTLQLLAFISSEVERIGRPSLVVAPTSLIYNWQDEAGKFLPDLKTVVISGMPKERYELMEEIASADLVITSYPLLRRDVELYKNTTFAYCVIDEAQHIKNPNSMNAKSVKEIKAEGYFALTGTPIENSLTELWSIFDFIMPGYLYNHSKFIKKIERPIIKGDDKAVLEQLTKQIRPFVLRRMKKDVLKELPDKVESKMMTELTPEQKKIYMAYLHEVRGEIKNDLSTQGFDKSRLKILAVLTRLRQICCHPSLFIENYEGESCKMQLLEEILEDALSGGHRILLFSQFTSMLEIIKRLLDSKEISYFYLDGSIASEERRNMVHAFQQGENDIFLISLKAGGTGLNLTGADMVIHFDPWWNPAVEEQATDRAHRIGQKNMVQVLKFITKGTIEEKIFDLQQRKKGLIDAVIQPGETMLSTLTENEIKYLFEIE